MKKLVIAACFLVSFSVSPVFAQNVGDACTPTRLTSPIWVPDGTGGDGQFLVCDGANWQRAIHFNSSGHVAIEQTSTTEAFKAGAEVIVGSSGLVCNANSEGGIRYNTTGNYLEFCNGVAWTPVAATTACDGTPSSFEFTDQTNVSQNTLTTSDILLIAGTDAACNVIVSVSGGDAPNFRICGDSSCSSVLVDWTATNTAYDMNGRYLQLRDTTASTANTTVNVIASVGGVDNTWSISTASAGACGASPTIGDTCSDGTVYAGQSPDGNVDMYVARCDVGLSWSGSACTGTRSQLYWSTSGVVTQVSTGYTSTVDGDVNTAGLAVTDSDSGTAGTQDHDAAKACADLNVHGHTDWYLPALDELDVIYENLVDGTPNDDNPDPLITGFTTGTYWSSTENGSNSARAESFSTGANGGYVYKYHNSPAIRCARRD